MTSLTIEQKRVDIYPSAKPGSPVIYLNTFSNAVNSVYKNLMALGCPDFCLVAVSELKWDHDMTPWLGCSPSTLSTKRMCLPAQRVCQVPSGLRASWNMCAPMR